MSEPFFSIQYSDKEVSDRLKRLLVLTGDLSPAMREIGETILLSTNERFVTETDPQGKRWEPLSPKTIALKRAEGKILRILQRTGIMRSRTSYNVSKDSCTITNNDQKAAKHQLGRGVPKREFLGVSREDRVEIITILDEHLKR